MVCLTFEADVIALGSQVSSDTSGAASKDSAIPAPSKSQDVDQSLGTLHALFATADAASNDAEERPRKKRKVDVNANISNQPLYLPEEQSVVLAKLSINLVISHI